ncbi:MAG: PEP-CTERM sorting domain-containing protein [Thermoguttaceae bacterium]
MVPWAGQNIGIALLQTATGTGATGFWGVGNVRLSSTPEPGSLALLAVAMGIFLGYRWRTRTR